MTLILTRASKDYVLQVTDRLVTQTGGKPFDPISNKNVLYCSRNGVVVLGYTGLAYLGGVPTDQWMVETLTGYTFDRDRKPPAVSPGPIRVRDIGQSLTMLKKGLENAPVEPKWSSDWKASSFDVCVSGWQRSRKRWRPVLGWLSKPKDALTIELAYVPRYWHWDRNQQQKGFKFKVGAAPDSNLSHPRRKVLVEKLTGCSADQAETIMVEAIREVSRSVPEVGPHCISVLLGPPSVVGARIRYIPLGAPALAVVSMSGGPTLAVPAAFTPWLVGPGVIFAPSIAAGSWQAQIGHYQIALEAPEPAGPGIQALLSGQQRPKLP
jgi:hypothetical protein